ncbi:intraflagellar transport protein 81 [Marchantia polymorpha subsp. ruderalis]|uniref:IFT81 calponin homology domain-containing protein n=2 Tax=Marchantia polymorpha TaxID=3197 RepID=A0AAF6AMM3_MARPO|nr:hypothetical protein MARPO_0036s0009 [Marchantia polymorpha]BBM97693.1 hypothetical protein Mp_1g07630 [Marchantia polymorpha subsp. ruderalis]|eukprot:PTQ40998.1 hypothetical protein MARPO_0036s0009 [Marchantia polymorpha]
MRLPWTSTYLFLNSVRKARCSYVSCSSESSLQSFLHRRSSFLDGIAAGNHDVIRPLLAWLLPQISTLQKRAFLARFLVDVEIPAELLLAEDMNKLHAQYDSLREQFIETHRHLEGLRQIERDPIKVKEHVSELQTERDHLLSKITKFKCKFQDVEKADELLEAVEEVKSLKVEMSKLVDTMIEQRQALNRSLGKNQKAYSKLQHMKILLEDAHNGSFFDKASHEIQALRFSAKQKLPEEVAAKQVHLHALQEVLCGPNKSEGLASIQSKLLAVNEELKNKRRNGLEKHSENEDASKRESMHWQRAQMGLILANRSQAANKKVAELTECRDKLQRDLDQKSTAIEEVKATVLRGEELKTYVESLRSKSAVYKKMKKELDDMDSEYGALIKNQKLLEEQIEMHPEFPEDKVDQTRKRATAKNLRKMIEEVNNLIKDLRNQLNPQVKELKLLRADLQSLEIEQAEKKQHYTDMCCLFDRKVTKLEAELASSTKEYENEKEGVKVRAASLEKLQATLMEENVEKENGSVSTKIKLKIEQQQEVLREVQRKQQAFKETEHFNSLQMGMMKDLLTLVAAKLSLYSSSSRLPIFSTATSLDTGDTSN